MRVYILIVVQNLYSGYSINDVHCTITIQLRVLLQGVSEPLFFFGFTFFHGQIIICILKLPSKTAKMQSKVRIVVQTSWIKCLEKDGWTL